MNNKHWPDNLVYDIFGPFNSEEKLTEIYKKVNKHILPIFLISTKILGAHLSTLIILRYRDKVSYDKIAVVCDITKETVRARIEKALRIFRNPRTIARINLYLLENSPNIYK